MSLQAAIFGVDGTLADTERHGHRIAFNAAFEDFGLNWHWNETFYGELLSIGGGKERIQHYVERIGMEFATPAGLDAFVTNLHAAQIRHFRTLLGERGIPLRPGVARLLRELREAGVRLAIATTSVPEVVDALLRTHLGESAPDWFEVIAAGDVMPAKKPSPDIYLWVLERLDLDAPSCLAFEDSKIGLSASRSAGLKTVITVNDYTSGQDFFGAIAVLSDLGEPDRPFRLLAGNAYDANYVDLTLMQQWLQP
ncbi:MAG TPA: HAD-IA family hydrolase [Methylococcus sp.]|nr:HAD-IA family hydrolase [Methylococcus sp.]